MPERADSVLASLPRPSSRRLAVRVTKDAQRHLRAGHPWVFEDSISSINGAGAPGDLAVVFDEQRRFVAIGLLDPASPIRIKILHHGEPQAIDAGWWRARLDAAIARRAPLVDRAAHTGAVTTGYRCIHGENDGLPGFVLDRYGSTFVIKLYSEAWFAHLATIVPLLLDALAPEALVLRTSRTLRGRLPEQLTEGMTLAGVPPTEAVAYLENGLHADADVVRGQKTGAFLDQRDNRATLRTMTLDRRVLDVFACTGGFSVHAAAGGARAVHSVDLSDAALAAARRNMARNRGLPAVVACAQTTTTGDAFDVMAALAGDAKRFDVVVVDPPSFTPNHAARPAALAAYARLTRLALGVLAPGGTLVQCSCSSRITADEFYDVVHATAAECGWRLDEIVRSGHPLDHPIGFPQGAYLKALFAQATR